MSVLPDLQAQIDQLKKIVEAQSAANAALQAQLASKGGSGVIMKVNDGDGQKGGISVFVNSRHPMTAYASQWLIFLDHVQAPADSPMPK